MLCGYVSIYGECGSLCEIMSEINNGQQTFLEKAEIRISRAVYENAEEFISSTLKAELKCAILSLISANIEE